MSRAERCALVERENPVLAVSQQCRLLAVSRSSIYRLPAEISDEDRAMMALIDRQYLVRAYYGSRRMAAWLATQGHPVPVGRYSLADARTASGNNAAATALCRASWRICRRTMWR
jgi:hypothetical protein